MEILADPNLQDDRMRELYDASLNGCVSSLKTLIQRDPLVLSRVSLYPFSETPLHIASLLGHLEFCRLLLDINPSLAGEVNSEGRCPLHLASAKGHTEIVKALLLTNSETCLIRDKDDKLPLHFAAMRGRVEAIKELISARPDSIREMTETDEGSILHLCIRYNHLEALKILVESMRGDNQFLPTKDKEGNTVLHLAVRRGQIKMIKYLLSLSEMSMTINTLNRAGLTPLDMLEHCPRCFVTHTIEHILTQEGAQRSANIVMAQQPVSLTPRLTGQQPMPSQIIATAQQEAPSPSNDHTPQPAQSSTSNGPPQPAAHPSPTIDPPQPSPSYDPQQSQPPTPSNDPPHPTQPSPDNDPPEPSPPIPCNDPHPPQPAQPSLSVDPPQPSPPTPCNGPPQPAQQLPSNGLQHPQEPSPSSDPPQLEQPSSNTDPPQPPQSLPSNDPQQPQLPSPSIDPLQLAQPSPVNNPPQPSSQPSPSNGPPQPQPIAQPSSSNSPPEPSSQPSPTPSTGANEQQHQRNRWDRFENFCTTYLINQGNWIDKKTKEQWMVAATVIAAMTFQSVISPPGGVWQADTTDGGYACTDYDFCEAGTAVVGYVWSPDFLKFIFFNSTSFFASLCVVLVLISGFPLQNKVIMWILAALMLVAITCMLLTYMWALGLVSPNHIYYRIRDLGYLLVGTWIVLLVAVGLIQITRVVFWVRSRHRPRSSTIAAQNLNQNSPRPVDE